MRDSLADRLTALAQRLERLKPLNHDPQAYHDEKDEIRRALIREAEALGGRRDAPNARGKFEAGKLRIGGRTVEAERRRARGPSEIAKVFR